MNLELTAMRWLWLEKNCHYIVQERSPRWGHGEPDVLGVTKDRYLIEIEIKRSVSDFHADAQKRHRINRDFYLEKQPKQTYYLMPETIAIKVYNRIPEWAGLMSVPHENTVNILKIAPTNKASTKLTLKECVKMTRAMTNHMMALALAHSSLKANFQNQDSSIHVHYVPTRNGTWEI